MFCQPYNDNINSMKKKRSVDLTENILYSIQQHKEFCEGEKISQTCCPLLNLIPVFSFQPVAMIDSNYLHY